MILKSIHLQNWRNFLDNQFLFNPFLTVIIGENAIGKTNLLEGLYFLVNGLGLREKKEEELIHFNKNQAKVEGSFIVSDSKFNFKIVIKKQNLLIKKEYFINNSQQKFSLYQKQTKKAVVFLPSDIEIIDNSAAKRRDYFNKFLSVTDYNYKKALQNFESALKKRNKLLQLEKEEKFLKEQLLFWDDYLEKQAAILTKKRQDYFDFLNQHQDLDKKKFCIEYLKNEFSAKRAKDYFSQEKIYKQTLIGPQRDEFQIYLIDNGFKKNIHRFGSRSEQRLALFWLKMNEVFFLEENLKNKPIILLDDIFSEFDYKNWQLILKLIKKYQTIINTTDINLLKFIQIPKSIITIQKNNNILKLKAI